MISCSTLQNMTVLILAVTLNLNLKGGTTSIIDSYYIFSEKHMRIQSCQHNKDKDDMLIETTVLELLEQIDTVSKHPVEGESIHSVSKLNTFCGFPFFKIHGYIGKNQTLFKQIYDIYSNSISEPNCIFFDTVNNSLCYDYESYDMAFQNSWLLSSYDLYRTENYTTKQHVNSIKAWLKLLRMHGIEHLRNNNISPLFKTNLELKTLDNVKIEYLDYDKLKKSIYAPKYYFNGAEVMFKYGERGYVNDTLEFTFTTNEHEYQIPINIYDLKGLEIINYNRDCMKYQQNTCQTTYYAILNFENNPNPGLAYIDTLKVIKGERNYENGVYENDMQSARLWHEIIVVYYDKP